MKREWWTDGPEDDPDESAMARITDDADLRDSFYQTHAAQFFGLIETPPWYPELFVAKAKELKEEWDAARFDELNQRKACAAESTMEDR